MSTMPQTKERTTEYELYSDKSEALDALADMSGANYLRPEDALGLLAPFTEAFGPDGDMAAAEMREAVAQECILSTDTLDITHTQPFDPILSAEDVSAVLADHLGADVVTSASSRGRGSAAKERHRGTVANIREHYNDKRDAPA